MNSWIVQRRGPSPRDSCDFYWFSSYSLCCWRGVMAAGHAPHRPPSCRESSVQHVRDDCGDFIVVHGKRRCRAYRAEDGPRQNGGKGHRAVVGRHEVPCGLLADCLRTPVRDQARIGGVGPDCLVAGALVAGAVLRLVRRRLTHPARLRKPSDTFVVRRCRLILFLRFEGAVLGVGRRGRRTGIRQSRSSRASAG